MGLLWKIVCSVIYFSYFTEAILTEINSNKTECDTRTTLNSSTLNKSDCLDIIQTIHHFHSSWRDTFTVANLKHSIAYTVAISVAYVIVFLIGIVGNFMVIAVIVLRSHMRTVSNLFILNLAVADAFILLFCLPPTLLANLFTPWTLGAFMCKAVTYIQGVSVMSSAYSLVAISIDRCKAIRQLSTSTNGFNERQATQIIGMIWIYSLLLTLPWIFAFEVQTLEEHEYCLEGWSNVGLETVYFYSITIFQNYVLPVILIGAANYLIWRKVSNRRLPQSADLSPLSSWRTQKARRKTLEGVERMLVIVTLTYIISWLPLYVLGTVHKVAPQIIAHTVMSEFLPLAQFLGYWNSCVNPVLYGFLNANFRKMFISLFPKWLVNRCCFLWRSEKRKLELPAKDFSSSVSVQGDFSLKRLGVPRASKESDESHQQNVADNLTRNEDRCLDPVASCSLSMYIITNDPNTQILTVV